MIIGSFNVENLFSRVRAMNLDDWADGRGILEEYSKVNARLQKDPYSNADKQAILDGLSSLGIDQTDESRWAILRQNRGRLLKRPQAGGVEVAANGRSDWIGWVELKREAVNEVATQMTARVIKDMNADVLAVIEAEDRTSLLRFNDQLLEPLNARYEHIMLIDGNDERGIDVGVLVRGGTTIESIVSHVDDVSGGKTIFSRDCPEFLLKSGSSTVLLMVNHLKSKGYGNAADSNAKRRAQAQRIRDIYDQRRGAGIDQIAIVGDLNDTPDSNPLEPLLQNGSDLQDIFDLPSFVKDGRDGTYANGTKGNKIDYILLSPALVGKVTTAGIERRGVWGGVNGTLFPHYPEMTQAVHSASDHAGLFVDVNL